MANKAETKPAAPANPAFFRGVRELADFLGVSPKTVTRNMKRHLLPFIRLHGCVLFRRCEIEKALERLTVPAIDGEKRKAVG
jgi:hypothetical protein